MTPDFTIADVLAWARTKPADEAYDFYDSDVCAIAQFGEATGRQRLVSVANIDTCPEISLELLEALVGGVGAVEARWTFGALVTRLEKLCPVPPSEWTRLDTYMAELASA